ncbi:hypothetical protein BDN72DRAFT_959146 [Pluteus cervinus]|uniref:Uncharacterized protein n=1 Tax=Pluteus cervinus TaxID=181527 RepID=A0ACD3AXE6_9AGAR|nr:hypothetical protein BDN72DRAFT_959146 [Pluteus cervinus]
MFLTVGPTLPLDVIGHVIDFVDDPITLRACSLLCRFCRRPCQRAIFSKYTLGRKDLRDYHNFRALLKSNHSLLGHIKSIKVLHFNVAADTLPKATRFLSNLQSITFDFDDPETIASDPGRVDTVAEFLLSIRLTHLSLVFKNDHNHFGKLVKPVASTLQHLNLDVSYLYWPIISFATIEKVIVAGVRSLPNLRRLSCVLGFDDNSDENLRQIQCFARICRAISNPDEISQLDVTYRIRHGVISDALAQDWLAMDKFFEGQYPFSSSQNINLVLYFDQGWVGRRWSLWQVEIFEDKFKESHKSLLQKVSVKWSRMVEEDTVTVS